MEADVHDFVSSCQICQQAKPDRSKLPGLLQTFPVPDRAWKILSLDFIEGLPQSEGFNSILVVVNLFSKYAHFVGLCHPFTAAIIAKVFFQAVYKYHGMPSALVSDRDKIFTSTLWRELFKLAKVELHMSTAYHSQSDGQTERVNQCLETFLRCFVHTCPVSGINGWTLLNSGITQVSTQLWGAPPLRFCMATLLLSLACNLLKTNRLLISRVGSMTENLCLLYCISTCSELSRE